MTKDIITLHGARIQTRAILAQARAAQVAVRVVQGMTAAAPVAEELKTLRELVDDLLDDMAALDDRLADALDPANDK